MTTTTPSPGAARMRRLRERKAHGRYRLWLELDPTTINSLVTLGWLDPDQRADESAVKAAFTGFVSQAFASQVTP